MKKIALYYGYLLFHREIIGVARGARAPPEFGRSVNPIQTMGADYVRHTTAVVAKTYFIS